MTGLPPKPGGFPRMVRKGNSPRAASMRDDPPRDSQRERDRDDRRRRSPPRQDGWSRQSRNGDRYPDQPSRNVRDRDDRDLEYRQRRVAMADRYIPDPSYSPRRRSPPQRRRGPSRSRSRSRAQGGHSPPPRRHKRSMSPFSRRSVSRSPRRRRSPPRSSRRSSRSRERRRRRSVSPRSRHRRRSSERSRSENRRHSRSLTPRSRDASETPDVDGYRRTAHRRKGSRSRSVSPPPQADGQVQNEGDGGPEISTEISEKEHSPAKKSLPHARPSGSRRARTPTGPRARSPISTARRSLDVQVARHEDAGKGKESLTAGRSDRRRRDRSTSPPPRPRKRSRTSSQSPTRSRSIGRSRSRSRSHSRPRAVSGSRSHSHSDSHSRSRSRSRSRRRSRSPKPPRARSPRSTSPSASPPRSHRTRSERFNGQAPTGPRGARHAPRRDQDGPKMPTLDDLLSPARPHPSRTPDLDAQIKATQEQRVKLEKEQVNIMRGVRRAQHELDLALMEQKSAEERRKAAERVHELVVKGLMEPNY